jgi:hypothetical protein
MADIDEEAKRQVPDQMVSFQGGVDSGHQPRLLNPDRCVRSVNCSYRGGFLANRPGFKKWFFRYADPSIQTAFEQGNFQGATFYPDLIYFKPSIMVAVDGNIYQLQLQSGYANVTRLSYSGVALNGFVPRIYFCTADKYLVAQDGITAPVIYDGATFYSSTTVPVGTLMAYGNGRLFVKVNTRIVRAGDLLGTTPTAPLTFTETDYLAEGGDFGPPSFVGDITAMNFIPTQDTATGQGPLLMMDPGGMVSANVRLDRTTWQTSQFQVVTLINNGALGDNSCIIMNGDLWYRAFDGWRSYRSARGQAGIWQQTALSNEVDHRIKDESKELLNYSSAIVYDNRLITTLMPQQGPHGIYHLGMLVLNFFPISSIAVTPNLGIGVYMQAYPAWNDMWTGIYPYQLLQGGVNGADRAFALVNESNHLQLFELSSNDPFDNFGSQDQPIQSSVETRAFTFGNDREEKRLYGGDVWFNNLKGDVQIKAFYRPDEYPNWYPWHEGLIRSKYRSETGDEIGTFPLNYYQPNFEPRFQMPTPQPYDEKTTSRKANLGYSFQLRLDISGCWSISRLRMRSLRLVELSKFPDLRVERGLVTPP